MRSNATSHTVTSHMLLEQLRDPENRTVWAAYVERYRPLVVRYFTRLGLQAGDAEDVAQEALMAFARSYREGKYDASKGRLRSWLFGIAHTKLRDWNRRNRRPADDATKESWTRIAESLADDDRLSELWEEQWRDAVLRACFDTVRQEVEPKTFEAFELFARQELPAREVAARLDISENAVFGAKRRVLQRIRELRPLLDDSW